MDDEEVAACVAEAVGRSTDGIMIEALQGMQGLLISRVIVPESGSYVFKAVRESMRREVLVRTLLARIAPDLTPQVVVSDQDYDRNLYWLITEDLGTRRLTDDPSESQFANAARALARIQQLAMPELLALIDLGVRCAGSNDWEEIALSTLESISNTSAIPRGELEEIVWASSDLGRDSAMIPTTLVHGDLHPGNVAVLPDGSVRLMDWGSAYLGSAFLGLEELLLPAARFVGSPENASGIKAAYLHEWASILGKPGPLEKPLLACRTLVRLQMLGASLKQNDLFSTTSAYKRLHDAWRAWQKAA